MSQMKFCGSPEKAVADYFSGFSYLFPNMTVDIENRIVISNQIKTNQVCVVSGGGSGHEPFAAGYVGDGILSGAVSGMVFASPPSNEILTTIRTLSEQNNNSGVLVIHANYTGDVLNFGLAVEEAKLHNIKVDIVIIDDDCSQNDGEIKGAGRRGLSGIAFALKITGNMARNGNSLSEIADVGRLINKSIGSIGATVTSCAVPGVGLLFNIGSDEVEIGVGVHGEAGVLRSKILPIEELVEKLTTKIIDHMNLSANANVCAIINNLGAVSNLEMNIIGSKIVSYLCSRSINVCRLYSGTFFTSLDMAGFQISILDVTNHPEWLSHLDAECSTPFWPGIGVSIPTTPVKKVQLRFEDEDAISAIGPKFKLNEAKLFKKCLKYMADVLIKSESKTNELDSIAGDGDAGTTLKRLAEGVLQNIDKLELDYPAVTFSKMSKISQGTMGGTSGALYAILLTAAAKFLKSSTVVDWRKVWKTSLDALLIHSKAKVGDRTMVDVLLPAYETFEQQLSKHNDVLLALTEVVKIAKLKCEETKKMKPRLGRASYVPADYITDVDPGAYAVTLWLEAILKCIQND